MDNVDNKQQHNIPEGDAAIELDSTSYEDWLANLNLPNEKTFQLEVHVEDSSNDENDGEENILRIEKPAKKLENIKDEDNAKDSKGESDIGDKSRKEKVIEVDDRLKSLTKEVANMIQGGEEVAEHECQKKVDQLKMILNILEAGKPESEDCKQDLEDERRKSKKPKLEGKRKNAKQPEKLENNSCIHKIDIDDAKLHVDKSNGDMPVQYDEKDNVKSVTESVVEKLQDEGGAGQITENKSDKVTLICKIADESIEKDVENENEGCSDDSEKSENQKCEERVSDGNSNNGKDVLDDVNKTNKIMSSIGIRKIDELNKSDENGTDKHVSCVVPKKPDGNGENGNAESGEAVTDTTFDSIEKMEGTEATGTATETVTFDDDDLLDTVDIDNLALHEDEDSPFPLSQNIHRPRYVKNEYGSSSHDGSDGEFDWSKLENGTKIPR